MMPHVTTTLRVKPDAATVGAVDDARAALVADVGSADVGDHLGHLVEGERVVTHLFACTRRGYVGWQWCVTVVRASRQKHVTVAEVVLIPGEGAIDLMAILRHLPPGIPMALEVPMTSWAREVGPEAVARRVREAATRLLAGTT